ncbi:lipocalin-like domain-containing protein [Streptomyces sp. 4N509B]|uniref:lipocalin-like domain-containing protein n=1 Tax=Streptomyces sp. 4N509B TaxID=3457413 RepID=UPI003FCFCF64
MTARPAPEPDALIGVWRMVSYTQEDESGRMVAGPLGDAPDGLLIYTADGHVSVSMAPTGSAATQESYMGYAGRWHLNGDEVIHEVLVSAHPPMVGTKQSRTPLLSEDGTLLTLRGAAVLPVGGRRPRRELNWRRVSP